MSHWLIIYDICDDKRLHHVAKIMESYAIRVQKSVFEMEGAKPVIEEIRRKVNKIIDGDDFVVYFEVCERDWQKRLKYGVGKKLGPEDKDLYIY